MNIQLFLKQHKILLLCICLHICFFLSAAYFGWFNIFFSAPALHLPDPNVLGIDFYQVPAGAWAFWHGGSLTGAAVHGKVYAPGQAVNPNVYHPALTLTLGSVLMLFKPQTAYYAWLWCKLPLSLAGVGYFYWSFRMRKYVQFASCILLADMSFYAELGAGQYQFLLNLFLLIFLTTLIKRYPGTVSATFYFLALLVKPVGLLFLPALLIKRRWKMACIVFGAFVAVTWLFNIVTKDAYYTNNLLNNILYPSNIITNQTITLNALLRSYRWDSSIYKLIQYSFLAVILLLIAFRRIHISKAIFLMIVYFLCFYNLVYEYDFSVLAYVIAPCMMCNTSFQTKLSRVAIVLICLPSCFVVLALMHVDVVHGVPGVLAWRLMVVSKFIPLFLLCISVLWADVIVCFKQAKIFFVAIKKLHDHLEIFG